MSLQPKLPAGRVSEKFICSRLSLPGQEALFLSLLGLTVTWGQRSPRLYGSLFLVLTLPLQGIAPLDATLSGQRTRSGCRRAGHSDKLGCAQLSEAGPWSVRKAPHRSPPGALHP